MEGESIRKLFNPEDYADLVKTADMLFQSGRGADDIVLTLAERIVRALEQEKRRERREAQMKGIAEARSRGVHLGRPKMEPPANFPLVLKQYFDGNITAAMAANLCGIGLSTFYRMKREALDAAED